MPILNTPPSLLARPAAPLGLRELLHNAGTGLASGARILVFRRR